MKHPILVIAVSLALLSFEVDCVDTISDKKKNEGEAEDYFSAKVKERRLNSDSNPKLVIAGLGDVGVGHGHGHNHHPNKVSNTTLKIIIRRIEKIMVYRKMSRTLRILYLDKSQCNPLFSKNKAKNRITLLIFLCNAIQAQLRKNLITRRCCHILMHNSYAAYL